jgi:hypothetical protein
MHVMGGLFGAIYINASTTNTASVLTTLSGLSRYLLLAQHFSMKNSDSSTDGTAFQTYSSLSSASGSGISINAGYTSSSVIDVVFVNGLFQPQVNTIPFLNRITIKNSVIAILNYWSVCYP